MTRFERLSLMVALLFGAASLALSVLSLSESSQANAIARAEQLAQVSAELDYLPIGHAGPHGSFNGTEAGTDVWYDAIIRVSNSGAAAAAVSRIRVDLGLQDDVASVESPTTNGWFPTPEGRLSRYFDTATFWFGSAGRPSGADGDPTPVPDILVLAAHDIFSARFHIGFSTPLRGDSMVGADGWTREGDQAAAGYTPLTASVRLTMTDGTTVRSNPLAFLYVDVEALPEVTPTTLWSPG